MQYNGIVIHFGEIWLKGRNRHSFISILRSNIAEALNGERYSKLEDRRDRFFLVLNEDSDMESIMGKLSHIFGISWFAPVVTAKNSMTSILDAAKRMLGPDDTVRIVPHRSVKNLDFSSVDVVSHFIKNSNSLGFTIDKNAKDELYINITKEHSYLHVGKRRSVGGLPVGSSGSAVILLSGGIDSPVASFYAMKRGLVPIHMHVHAFPSNEDDKISKIKELGKILSKYYPKQKLYLMPAHVFQSAAMKTPKRYELVLFKLFLYRLAEGIADMEDADCIVSGESLGQVASQTIENLASSQRGVKRLIIRPLIGFDKQEIIDIAKSIGTYDESVRKYKDVCSIAARNPATRSKADVIKRLWDEVDMEQAVRMTLEKASVVG